MGRMVSGLPNRAFAALLILAMAAGTAVADELEAVVSAAAYEPIPQTDLVQVRSLDDSNTNLQIKRHLEEALRQRGFAVSEADSPLVLSFETRHDAAAGPAPRAQKTTQVRERESRQSVHGTRTIPKIIENPRDRTTVVATTRYRLDAIITDRGTGKRLWHGWIAADLGDRNTEALGRAMVNPLVNAIGDTIRQETVELSVN